MAALPDAGKISDAFSTSSRALAVASEEFGRIVNLPAFDQGQRIFEVLERLERKIDRSIERTDTLRTDMNNRFDGLELRLRADSRNQMARLYNSHITNRETQLRALYDQRNMAVDGFPRDSASLMRIQANPITALLTAYDLPTDGTLELKKRRFREFVGLVVDA